LGNEPPSSFLLLACPKLQVLDSAHFSVEKHRVQWVEDSKSKLLLPDFDDLIKCHDICIFLESKIDDLDILNLPNGYKSFSQCRQKFCKKSGGITIVFKTEYERYHIDCYFLIMR
jgi:hypothetical protein